MRNGEVTLRHLLAPVQDVLDDPGDNRNRRAAAG